jgi:hypothetical protein
MATLHAAPAAKDVLDAIEVLRAMNTGNARKVPAEAPIRFVKKRWEKLVITNEGIDRRYYELCALSELKNALRSGDIWVQGSRQFKDFNGYLIPTEKFSALRQAGELPLAVTTSCDQYLHDRLTLLEQQLETTNRLGAHQPDRRLPVAQLQQGRCREIQAIAATADALACYNFRFLWRPHSHAIGATVPDDLLAHVAPLGWEHIALTGDYVWTNSNAATGFRPLGDVPSAFLTRAA